MKKVMLITLLAVGLSKPALGDNQCLFDPLTGAPEHLAEFQQCTLSAARLYNLPTGVLVALKRTESSLLVDPQTTGYNTDGSVDIGPMQVNLDVWRTEFRRMKNIEVQAWELRDICTNVYTAAWILNLRLREQNGDLFEAIGRYHSGTPHLKQDYQDRFNKQSRLMLDHCHRTKSPELAAH